MITRPKQAQALYAMLPQAKRDGILNPSGISGGSEVLHAGHGAPAPRRPRGVKMILANPALIGANWADTHARFRFARAGPVSLAALFGSGCRKYSIASRYDSIILLQDLHGGRLFAELG